MIVYIAGKMTGLPDLGRKAFAEAEKKLAAEGHTVLNPAWLPTNLPEERYMPICLHDRRGGGGVSVGRLGGQQRRAVRKDIRGVSPEEDFL